MNRFGPGHGSFIVERQFNGHVVRRTRSRVSGAARDKSTTPSPPRKSFESENDSSPRPRTPRAERRFQRVRGVSKKSKSRSFSVFRRSRPVRLCRAFAQTTHTRAVKNREKRACVSVDVAAHTRPGER